MSNILQSDIGARLESMVHVIVRQRLVGCDRRAAPERYLYSRTAGRQHRGFVIVEGRSCNRCLFVRRGQLNPLFGVIRMRLLSWLPSRYGSGLGRIAHSDY